MKIIVYAICKNESKFVNRWMDSMTEADAVVVLDTGSSDDTVEKLRRRGATVEAGRDRFPGASTPLVTVHWPWCRTMQISASAPI